MVAYRITARLAVIAVITMTLTATASAQFLPPPTGSWLLQPGDGRTVANNKKLLQAFSNPKIVGLTIRVPADVLRPIPMKWDWTVTDSSVNICHKLNKPYKILVMSGNNTPGWIGGTWVSHAPLPWSINNVNFYTQTLLAVGQRYSPDPFYIALHITGGTRGGTSEELHPDNAWYRYANTDKNMVMAYSKFTDAGIMGSPGRTLLLAVSGSSKAKNYCNGIINYGLSTGVPLVVKQNILQANTSIPYCQITIDACKRGSRMGFERVNPVGNVSGAIQRAEEIAAQAKYPADQLYIDFYLDDVAQLP